MRQESVEPTADNLEHAMRLQRMVVGFLRGAPSQEVETAADEVLQYLREMKNWKDQETAELVKDAMRKHNTTTTDITGETWSKRG